MNKHIQVILPEKLRNEFHEINKEKSINSSALLRKWIENYVKENK